MKHVIKRNKKKQTYTIKKLERAVEKAAKDAKISLKGRKKLIHEVAHTLHYKLKGRTSIKTTDLRRLILRRLDRRSKKTARAWRRHDNRKKRRK